MSEIQGCILYFMAWFYIWVGKVALVSCFKMDSHTHVKNKIKVQNFLASIPIAENFGNCKASLLQIHVSFTGEAKRALKGELSRGALYEMCNFFLSPPNCQWEPRKRHNSFKAQRECQCWLQNRFFFFFRSK